MFTIVTDSDYKEKIEATQAGVMICHKQQCPHCKNMEKVLEKLAKKIGGLAFLKLDSEANPEALAALDAERAPTILVIKSGRIVARKAGLMNPKEMVAYYKAA